MNRPIRRVTAHLEGRSLRRSDFWCSVSHYTAGKTKALFGLRTDAAAVLPNPVVAMPAASWSGRRPGLVVFSGTLTEKKGVIPLIDAWRAVVARFPDAALCMLGKDGVAPSGGSMTDFLRQRLGESAEGRVQFTGHVSRDVVMRHLSEARVAVFPSYAEAFAIAPLEAMSVGCPTIASALGSGPELIDSGVDGLTVDPHHSPEIAQAVCRLLGDEPLAAAMGERGRRTIVDRFSLGPLLPQNVAFYDDCVRLFVSRRRGTRSERPRSTRVAAPVPASKPAAPVRHDAR
jgi:glycosyltransferase involved in cell wall biosynthesis